MVAVPAADGLVIGLGETAGAHAARDAHRTRQVASSVHVDARFRLTDPVPFTSDWCQPVLELGTSGTLMMRVRGATATRAASSLLSTPPLPLVAPFGSAAETKDPPAGCELVMEAPSPAQAAGKHRQPGSGSGVSRAGAPALLLRRDLRNTLIAITVLVVLLFLFVLYVILSQPYVSPVVPFASP